MYVRSNTKYTTRHGAVSVFVSLLRGFVGCLLVFASIGLVGLVDRVEAQSHTPTTTRTPTLTRTPTQTPTVTNTAAITPSCDYLTTGAPYGTIYWTTQTISDTDTHTIIDAPTGDLAGRKIQPAYVSISATAATAITVNIGDLLFKTYIFGDAGTQVDNFGPNLPACIGTGNLTVDQSGGGAFQITVGWRLSS